MGRSFREIDTLIKITESSWINLKSTLSDKK